MAPAPGTTVPGSRRDTIRQFLNSNQGYYQPMQVANALGLVDRRERLRVYDELARLARDGLITRLQAPPRPGKRRPVTTYGAPPPPTKRRPKSDPPSTV